MSRWALALGGFVLTGLLALTGWMLNTEGRLSGLAQGNAATDAAQQDKIIALESGLTTPMAAETRVMFAAHGARIQAVERAVIDLAKSHREIMDRLPRRAGKNDPKQPGDTAATPLYPQLPQGG